MLYFLFYIVYYKLSFNERYKVNIKFTLNLHYLFYGFAKIAPKEDDDVKV